MWVDNGEGPLGRVRALHPGRMKRQVQRSRGCMEFAFRGGWEAWGWSRGVKGGEKG